MLGGEESEKSQLLVLEVKMNYVVALLTPAKTIGGKNITPNTFICIHNVHVLRNWKLETFSDFPNFCEASKFFADP